jgi:predicted dehydrogenase
MPQIRWFVDVESESLQAAIAELRSTLAAAGFTDAGARGTTLDFTGDDAVVVWADRPLSEDLIRALSGGTVRVVFAGPTLSDADPEGRLAELAGLRGQGVTPTHDIRLRPGHAAEHGIGLPAHSHGDVVHRDRHDHVTDRLLLVDKVTDDVDVLRTARVALVEHPVMTWRPTTAVGAWTIGTIPAAVASRAATRLFVQMMRLVCDLPQPTAVRIGLLGYGGIGHEHSRAVRATDGLDLVAVCDTSAGRLADAQASAPGIATTTSADELIARDDLDLIVVSTPPNSHASWAQRVIASGKHVIVVKPFAIRTDEADAVLDAAAAASRLAVVYQNRRYDPDYVALRKLVRAGALGDVFHVETFVGGYGHPCNLWHSDAGVSGGAFYDWGSHFIDQMLDLIPGEIDYVTAVEHKLQWFDVTNADQSRVTIHFANGVEAEFVHSDLAAALKPRWYVLGTKGAVVGNWRTEKIVARNDVGTLVEDVLAPADSPPVMHLHSGDGAVSTIPTPSGDPYGFHHELADQLHYGISMTVTGAQARRVLSVMEAAATSAADGGRPVIPR